MTTAMCNSACQTNGALLRHERAVAAFLASCDPDRLRAVQLRWPVLSAHQMRHRLRREIPVGDERDVEIVARRVRADGRR